MKLGPTSRRVAVGFSLWVMLLLAGCGLIPLPDSLPVDPGKLEQLPGVPSNMDEVQDLMRDLGLPDLSRLADVPGLESLPQLSVPPGAIVFQGPLDQAIDPGERVPGSDIELVDITGDTAIFRIAGLRAERQIGDSLDYDGDWPNLDGVSYSLRLRVYRVNNDQVRAAGVHRLTIANASPQAADVDLGNDAMRFPYTVSAVPDALFSGLTFGYGGLDDRGAVLTGLGSDDYPYRKLGDSVNWQGYVRADLPVEYHLRMLYYQEDSARVGGVVLISLPSQ